MQGGFLACYSIFWSIEWFKKNPFCKFYFFNLALSNAQIYFLEHVKISAFLIGLHLLNKV